MINPDIEARITVVDEDEHETFQEFKESPRRAKLILMQAAGGFALMGTVVEAGIAAESYYVGNPPLFSVAIGGAAALCAAGGISMFHKGIDRAYKEGYTDGMADTINPALDFTREAIEDIQRPSSN